MAVCSSCGNYYPDTRDSHICIECGDKVAQEELRLKHLRIGVAWNKGPEMYLGSAETTKRVLRTEGGRKHLPIDNSPSTLSTPRVAAIPVASKPKTKKVFDRWEWPVNKLGHRYKRAVMKEVPDE